jgi:hypothetical protein
MGTRGSWIDLNPAGASSSIAWGVDEDRQVGEATVGGQRRASLWSGSAGSWVDLNPADSYESNAVGIDRSQQVGFAVIAGVSHASLWTGSAASWVSLNPAGAGGSNASAVDDGWQVGTAIVQGVNHASLWSGSAGSWVDLHAFLPAWFRDSNAMGIWHDGSSTYVVGVGFNTVTGRSEALMWMGPAPCRADFNNDGWVDSVDFFDFVAAFFAGSPGADFNEDGVVDSQDFFAFLSAYFAGC